MSQDRLSSLAVLHIEREYVNRVLLEDMDRMINVFGERSGRNVLFFQFQVFNDKITVMLINIEHCI